MNLSNKQQAKSATSNNISNGKHQKQISLCVRGGRWGFVHNPWLEMSLPVA